MRLPALEGSGFSRTNLRALGMAGGSARRRALADDFRGPRIDRYAEARDFPALKGPELPVAGAALRDAVGAHLAAHDRVHQGSRGAATWLSELVWRDFYHQILHHHPRVCTRRTGPECDALRWEHGRHADAAFEAWAQGRTGYPARGRGDGPDPPDRLHAQPGLRMVTASFLVKDLGISGAAARRTSRCT